MPKYPKCLLYSMHLRNDTNQRGIIHDGDGKMIKTNLSQRGKRYMQIWETEEFS